MSAEIKISGQWKDISKIFIKVAGQWKTVQQGFIKVLGQWRQFFIFASNPNQTVRPSAPTGTGAAGTNVLIGDSGVYTNYISISKSLIYVTQGTSLTDGLTTQSGTAVTSNHTVTQLNATTPPVVFYTRDEVKSLDGVTIYYYYSQNGVTAFINTFTDTFDHGTINEINSTLSYLSYKNPNPDNSNSWIQQSNEAFASYTPLISDNPTTYPMRTIEVGKSSVNIQASLPNAFSGPGLAFWVTARGSWWAVGTWYNTAVENVTSTGCTGTRVSHDRQTCTSLPAGACECEAGGTSNIIDCNGTTTHYTSSALANAECGSCTVTQNTNHYQSCPTPTTSSPTYSDNTLGTGCGDKCSCLGPYTSNVTAYRCGATETAQGFPEVVVSVCNVNNVGSPCNQRIVNEDGFTVYYIRRCESYTDTVTYWHCTTRSCSDSWSCTYRNITTTTNATYKTIETTTTPTTFYKSHLRIYSANGSSVTSVVQHTVGSRTSGYHYIYGIKTNVANDTIEASAYTNESLTTQLGTTVSYTAIDPTKSLPNGESSVGIIKLPVNEEGGSRLDNFNYTRV